MFPCAECIVKVVCTKFCEKISGRSRMETSKLICDNICPDCGGYVEHEKFQSSYTSNIRKCNNCNHSFTMVGRFFSYRGIK